MAGHGVVRRWARRRRRWARGGGLALLVEGLAHGLRGDGDGQEAVD